MKIRSKKEIQENKEKRLKLLKIFKRVLDVIIYLWALILTIGLIVGSCSNKNVSSQNNSINQNNLVRNQQRVDVVDDSSLYLYWNENRLTSNWQDNEDFEVQFISPISSGSEFRVIVSGSMLINGTNYSLTKIDFWFEGTYPFYFTLVRAYDTEGEYHDILNGSTFNNYLIQIDIESYHITTSPNSNNLSVKELSRRGFLNHFTYRFDNSVKSTFTFNNKLNYYYFAGQNSTSDKVDSLYDLVYSTSFSGHTTYEIHISLPFFKSNGYIYNEIVLTYYLYGLASGNTWYWYAGNGQIGVLELSSNTGFFHHMTYRNTLNNVNQQIVYSRNIVYGQYQGETQQGYGNDCYWVSSAYKFLQFLEPLEYGSSSYGDLVTLNTLDTYQGYTGSGSILDVFTLLRDSFSSFVPFLNLAIFPGMTIGMLLFLPLMGAIIVIIVKVVKK